MRRPHLVTFEDPIEEFLTKRSATAREHGLDYTPRQFGRDAESLEQVCKDALRQTPSVLYVGEVRTKDDWRHVMEFAGSGHLVVTTAHAGSLVEAMDRIFFAVEAITPAQRGHYAQRILAVVHQKPVSADTRFAILPALWRQTSAGLDALVSSGLSSVIPHNPPHNPSDKLLAQTSSIGRFWFAQAFFPSTYTQLAKNAATLDLQGT